MKTIELSGDFDGPLGLQLWSLREHAEGDVAERLATARRFGFQEVELAGTYGLKPAEYRAMLDEAGLNPTAMHSGYERFRDSLSVVLDEAEALGVTALGIAWIPHERGKPFTNAMARKAATDFNRFGAAAKERGLQFYYHVHGYEFRPGADGSTPFDAMVKATDPANVKYEMDVFWVTHSGTDPAQLLRKYPDRWRLMHIKDMKVGWPTGDYSGGTSNEADVPIGTGQINWSEVLAAAEEIGL
ncbi:MAG: sugar phosphate isomerase/epimerase, partial [Rhodothermales bacterium]|nr:sugar phosphate isomerase/epimerase [Rhodothermales bacterium]